MTVGAVARVQRDHVHAIQVRRDARRDSGASASLSELLLNRERFDLKRTFTLLLSICLVASIVIGLAVVA